jgi:hypothetical protein
LEFSNLWKKEKAGSRTPPTIHFLWIFSASLLALSVPASAFGGVFFVAIKTARGRR